MYARPAIHHFRWLVPSTSETEVMGSGVINEGRLCCMTELEIARYSGQLRGRFVHGDIIADLAAATESQTIPPLAFCIWLTASKYNGALKAALTQSYSSRLRKSALRRVRHVMTSSTWRELTKTMNWAPQQPFFSLAHRSPWQKLREIYRRVVEY